MADVTEAARLAHRRLKELRGEVVTRHATRVRKVARHWLIGVLRFLLCAEVTSRARDFAMLLLIVRKVLAGKCGFSCCVRR